MKKSWAALLCVVYLTSAAGVVGAENNSSTSVVSVDESQNNASDEQSRRMKDITVTATRTEALVRDVSAPMLTVDKILRCVVPNLVIH